MCYQQFPTTKPLSENVDKTKAELADLIEDNSDAVYGYVMSSVKLNGKLLRQTGTGPNFQGGCVTLCTCKHRMRTSLPSKEWANKWIAGFTSLLTVA